MSDLHVIKFESKGPAEKGLAELKGLEPGVILEGTPNIQGHTYYTDETGTVRAGVFESTPFTTKLIPHRVHEFMHILEGSVTIISKDGHEELVHAGDSLVIPKGSPHIWKQTEPLRKFYYVFDDPSGLEPDDPESLRGIKVDPKIPLSPLEVEDPSRVFGDVPTWQLHIFYKDVTERMSVGIWSTTEMHERPRKTDYPELMHILEGSGSFTNGDNVSKAFETGDTLLAPPGMTIKLDTDAYVRKIYCSVVPQP
jgi:uncharacterized cupin superfamily protein